MSEMWGHTGETIVGTCHRCGQRVSREKLLGMYSGRYRMHVPPHDAPCGLQCFGGGVRGKDYGRGNYHRSDEECPRCGTTGDKEGQG